MGPSTISAEWETGTPEEEERRSEQADECYCQIQAVEDVWVLQHERSKKERDAALPALPGCLADAGLDVATDASVDDAGAAYQEFMAAHQQLNDSDADPQLAAVAECASVPMASSAVAAHSLAEALDKLDT